MKNIRSYLKAAMIILFTLALVSLAACSAPGAPAQKGDSGEDGLTQKDFTEAKNKPGTVTSKGIVYQEEDDSTPYYSFEPGTYKLAEDITIKDCIIEIDKEGEFIFDLNGKSLNRSGEWSGFFYFSKGKLTITGDGKMSNDPSILTLIDCEAVIDNGTFDGSVTCKSYERKTSLTVNKADFNGTVWVTGKNAEGTFNNGTFAGGLNAALMVSNGASATVNDGTYTSGEAAFEANTITESSADGEPAKSIIINGGTFKTTVDVQDPDVAPIGGIFLENCEKVTLNGGSFLSEGNAAGAIVASADPKKPYDDFKNFLGAGYKYSEELQLNAVEIEKKEYQASQSSISVIADQ